MLGFLSTSFFFVTMVVASGTVQFSMWADLLLNLIDRKIQDDSEGNFMSQDTGHHLHEIRPSSELTGCPLHIC